MQERIQITTRFPGFYTLSLPLQPAPRSGTTAWPVLQKGSRGPLHGGATTLTSNCVEWIHQDVVALSLKSPKQVVP